MNFGKTASRMDTPKEIIVFTDNMGDCGISRVLSELTAEWIVAGHKVTVVYIDKNEGRLSDYAWHPEIELISIPSASSAVLLYFRLIRSYIHIMRKRPNAIAVSLSVMTNFAIGAASFWVKNKIVISDRNDPRRRPAGKVKQFFRDLAFKRADTLIFQTADVGKYYQERIHKNGVVIPNPINKNLPLPIPQGASRRPVIVTAGRLNKQKNLSLLIAAFAKLAGRHPEYTLELYGRGREEEQLKKVAAELSVGDKVIFKGFSSNLYDDIKDCSLYVCSSDYEGISNALLEALGMGLPTISTDCPVGGSRLLIQNEENGILVGVGNVEELSTQMERIISDAELARRLSANAVCVREKYTVGKIAQMWLDNM